MIGEPLFRRFLPDSSGPIDPAVRAGVGRLEAWVSIVVNTALAALKGVLGLAIGSLALLADAVHTISDIATSAVVLFGFKIASKPADREHPFGHGRAEYVATLIIAVILGVVGFEFIKSAVGRLMAPVPISAGWGVLAAILATVLVKLWMGQFALLLGQRIESSTLKADAWHHRSDAFSSVLVLVAVAGSANGYLILDGLGGLLVGLYMIVTGYRLAREVIDPLLGAPPPAALVQQIRALCRDQPRVFDAHDITVHNYGHHLFLGLHVEVDQQLSAQDAHDIAESVTAQLRTQLGAYATVHIDPVDRESAAVQEVSQRLKELQQDSDIFTGFHDLRVVNTPQHRAILVDVEIHPRAGSGKRQAIRQWLAEELASTFPGREVDVQVSPLHSYR